MHSYGHRQIPATPAPKKKFPHMNKFVKTGTILMILLTIESHLFAQVKDSTTLKPEKPLKNAIKLNLTTWILYDGFQLNYERILSPNRSITFFGGPIEFPMPDVISNSPLVFNGDKTKSGYVFGSEYRFYLSEENKYAAPHGVYLAPFVSFYHFHNTRKGRDTLNQTDAYLGTTMNFFNIGGEIGYQFVIKKRFVIDCVLFGPAISSYYFNVKLEGDPRVHDEQVQAILDAMKEKFPILKDLSSSEGISTSGVSNFWSLGFRYAIHIGYRF
jgi:hypothetical protein